jgi:Pvc16 N-terminal domain
MLPELHQALQDLIYQHGRIDRSEVDVVFDVPTSELIDRLTKPTLSIYLVDLVENTDLRQAQFRTAHSNGKTEFRAPPRRIDLRYMVSALTPNADDAFRLLWRVMGVLISLPEIPAEALPSRLKLEFPIIAQTAHPEAGVKLLDVWSALNGEPRAAFTYVLTVPMEVMLAFEAPLVLARSIGYRSLNRIGGPESPSFQRPIPHDPGSTDVTSFTAPENTPVT